LDGRALGFRFAEQPSSTPDYPARFNPDRSFIIDAAIPYVGALDGTWRTIKGGICLVIVKKKNETLCVTFHPDGNDWTLKSTSDDKVMARVYDPVATNRPIPQRSSASVPTSTSTPTSNPAPPPAPGVVLSSKAWRDLFDGRMLTAQMKPQYPNPALTYLYFHQDQRHTHVQATVMPNGATQTISGTWQDRDDGFCTRFEVEEHCYQVRPTVGGWLLDEYGLTMLLLMDDRITAMTTFTR
jgi:hypothetical protein